MRYRKNSIGTDGAQRIYGCIAAGNISAGIGAGREYAVLE